MMQAYIVAATRTAGGRRKGALRNWHPAMLGGAVLDELVRGSRVDGACIEDVIMGCVSQGGEQSQQIGRSAVLAAKALPDSVPAVTIDRQCGSSQQAVQFAAQAVMSGTMDMVIAAGVESMTRVPMGSPTGLYDKAGIGEGPWPHQVLERFGINAFSQFTGAEMVARKWALTREELDAYSLESHRRAAAATEAGAFADEILVLEGVDAEGTPMRHDRDEGIRADATLEAIAGVDPILEGGIVTAASASQMCDGASGVLIVSEKALKAHGLAPLARIATLAVTAGDPVIMLEEPIAATRKALEKAGMRMGEIDLFEVNEAFAPIPLAWMKALGADPAKTNALGGAIAMGHPLGASGTRLMTTLIHALRSGAGRWGLQTMCEGGGIANVTIIEAL